MVQCLSLHIVEQCLFCRRGPLPNPLTQQYAMNSSSGNIAVPDAVYGQLSSANYSSGGIPISPMASSSYMHLGSLSRVLAPWNQQGAVSQNPPVGSLEALRATWRAPHNSYNTGQASCAPFYTVLHHKVEEVQIQAMALHLRRSHSPWKSCLIAYCARFYLGVDDYQSILQDIGSGISYL